MPSPLERFLQLDFWGNSLGLLPIQLSIKDDSKFILLNGGIGDFCLQLKEQLLDPNFYYSSAWSSNTKNFVVYEGDGLKIYNWKKNKVESVRLETIENNLSNFYKYLVQTNPKSELDIVPFITNIFKQLRNLTNEKTNGIEALNLLFLLLASLEDTDVTKIDTKKWGIDSINIPSSFENYIEQFQSGILDLKPNLELILRHTSGHLFQEAHKEAVFFSKQIGMFSSLLSSDYEVTKLLYSSIHYTPSYIARSIVENCLNQLDYSKPTITILDPACGSSEFLVEVLKQLKSRNYLGNIKITGWDSSAAAISTSKFLLTYEKREWGDNLDIEILLVEDSLKEDWTFRYDLIVMNPPFLSWELMNNNERDSAMSVLKNLVSRRPNQASAFFYKAIQSLDFGGIIGCVLPSSIFSFPVYDELRRKINETISFTLIGMLGNFVFEEALTDISILTAKKSKSNESPVIVWTKNQKGISAEALRELRRFEKSSFPFINTKNFSVYRSESFPTKAENWKPVSYQENEVIKKMEENVFAGGLVRVDDIFHVKLGIRTGNKVFKISSSYLKSLPETEQKYFRPVIDNEAIEKGIIDIKNYIWYPYSEKQVLITSEEALQKKVPIYYSQMLNPVKNILSNRSRKSEMDWWLLSEPLSWLRKQDPKLISTEFGRSGSFAFDQEGHFLVERGNGWIPKKPFLHLDSNFFYLAIFCSPFFDSLLSIYSKPILSGWNLGKASTKSIPIPSVFSNNVPGSYYQNIVDIGKQISTGNFFHLGLLDEMVTKNLYNIENR